MRWRCVVMMKRIKPGSVGEVGHHWTRTVVRFHSIGAINKKNGAQVSGPYDKRRPWVQLTLAILKIKRHRCHEAFWSFPAQDCSSASMPAIIDIRYTYGALLIGCFAAVA